LCFLLFAFSSFCLAGCVAIVCYLWLSSRPRGEASFTVSWAPFLLLFPSILRTMVRRGPNPRRLLLTFKVFGFLPFFFSLPEMTPHLFAR